MGPEEAVVGTVLEVWRFPVKSMLGERIERARLTATGIVGARRYGVLDVDTGKLMTAKLYGDLLTARARTEAEAEGGSGSVVITLPEGPDVRADDPAVHDALSTWLG